MAGLKAKSGSIARARHTLAGIESLSESTQRRVLKRGAETIEKLAEDYAPRDTAALEGAIESAPDGQDGKVRYTVYIDGSHSRPGHGSEKVGDYADRVHDEYNDATPGPGTAAKRAAGQRAGALFMYRAVTETEPEIAEDLKRSVARSIKRASSK